MSGTLLAIDGDSLAHRAYHAIPKSIRGNGRPANALVGFAGFLIRLWDAEQPGGGARRLGLARDADLPARGAARLPVGPRVRGRDPRAARAAARALTESFGFPVGKAPGYEADDFLAAAARDVARAGDASSPPTATRSSSSPTASRSCSRSRASRSSRGSARAEVRERYGVEPEQVPDFIALRGDPSDKIPGAPGVGPKKAADVLKQHGSLDAGARRRALPADRRRPAALPLDRNHGRDAPLPKLTPTPPDWARRVRPRAGARARVARRSASPPRT